MRDRNRERTTTSHFDNIKLNVKWIYANIGKKTKLVVFLAFFKINLFNPVNLQTNSIELFKGRIVKQVEIVEFVCWRRKKERKRKCRRKKWVQREWSENNGYWETAVEYLREQNYRWITNPISNVNHLDWPSDRSYPLPEYATDQIILHIQTSLRQPVLSQEKVLND